MFNLFQLLSDREEPDPAQEQEQARPQIVTDPQQIEQLLGEAVNSENFLTVTLAGERLQFYTLFLLQENSSDYLAQHDYLLVAPLDPPIGNIKLRSAKEIVIDFFTQRHVVSAQVDYRGQTVGRGIQLGFPTRLVASSQKRAGVRIIPDGRLAISVTIVRPSGLSFSAAIDDISMGGVAFANFSQEARLEHGARVTMIFEVAGHPTVQSEGVVLGVVQKHGRSCLRVRFRLATSAQVRALGELTAFIQRDVLQRRADRFT